MRGSPAPPVDRREGVVGSDARGAKWYPRKNATAQSIAKTATEAVEYRAMVIGMAGRLECILLPEVEEQTLRTLDIERHRLARDIEDRLTSLYEDVRTNLGAVREDDRVDSGVRRMTYELLSVYAQLFLARRASILLPAAELENTARRIDPTGRRDAQLEYLDGVFGFWFARAEDHGAWGTSLRDGGKKIWRDAFVEAVDELIAEARSQADSATG